MALGGLAEGLLAAQNIIGQQQDQRYKQALLQLNLQNQQRQRQANAASWAALMSGGGMGGGAMPSPGQPSPMPTPPAPSAPPPQSAGGVGMPAGITPSQGDYGGPGSPMDLSRLQNEILKLESGGRMDIPNSSAGAVGPMQIMPSTARGYGVGNVGGLPDRGLGLGKQIVGDLYGKYGGNPDLTAIAYNAGPKRADAVAGGAPLSSLPGETQKYIANLHADLDLPPAKATEASNAAVDVAAAVPPQFAGRISLQQVAQMVERSAGRGVPDDVKFAAVANLYKLMAPAAQQQFQQAWEAYKFGAQQSQHREDIGLRTQEMEAGRAQTRELSEERMGIQRTAAEAAHGADWQIVQTPDGKTLRVNRKTGESAPVDLPAGTAKFGAGGAPAEPAEVKYWATILKNGGALPPGLSRTAAGAKLVQSIMKEMSESGDPNDFIANHATVTADARSLANMTKMTDAAESFERTANANLDNALRLSKGAVPTDMGPFVNKWIETGETQAGDASVPPYVAAILTAANEYAKIMNGSTGSQGSTVDSRREAAEMLSPYLSTGQISAVAQVLKQDMANRKRELLGQVSDIKARLQGAGKPAQDQGTKYTVGQVIDTPKGKMRVTGGDLNGDPDVEPVK